MSLKIESLLKNEGTNHIFPFLWLHGEEEDVLRDYMRAINECGIGAVCIESRPHPDYCGPKWWQDMDIILDEARKRNMKIWILDDSHFPTGYANGAMKDAPPELCKQYLYFSTIEVVGPMNPVQINLTKHCKYMRNPMEGGMLGQGGQKERRVFDDDKLLSVCAVRINEGFDPSSLIDLTEIVRDQKLDWNVPKGRWMIYVNFLTRNAGYHDEYINLVNYKSVNKLIEAVYEPHFDHYKDEFGKTIAGFFSDEPELGNGSNYNNRGIGENQDLPWSEEVEFQMEQRLGKEWKLYLPMLWDEGMHKEESCRIRYTYMDIITRLVETDFSKHLGSWCEAHGVEYIGHMIEDNNSHTKLGSTLGHFFRGLSGQHMSGIDDIGGQVYPAGELYPKRAIINERDGEFYHYLLGKLGSSQAAIDPIKHGRAMCEIFGAYRWSEGVRMMKYLTDHFLVRGINHFVPHAFSAKPYPDPDCPPHFYAGGNDPQFKHFGDLMRYMNRGCALISNGHRVAPVAMLYQAEAEWSGKYMENQTVAHQLLDHQLDFDIIPSDVFQEKERYQTSLKSPLQVNTQIYEALVVPYAQYITEDTALAIIELLKSGLPIYFVEAMPDGIIGGDKTLIEQMQPCKVVQCESLARSLRHEGIFTIGLEQDFKMLRYLHYKEDKEDRFIFTNENMFETFSGKITLPITTTVFGYDMWKNEVFEVVQERSDGKNEVTIEVPPYQSVVLISGSVEGKIRPLMQNIVNNYEFLDTWTRSAVRAIDYPNFSEEKRCEMFESYALEEPGFSGIIRYKNRVKMDQTVNVMLLIEDAFEGVEVFINDISVGTAIAPPFAFDISDALIKGYNDIKIEVATTLERERYFAPPTQGDWYAMLSKGPALSPTGITGKVQLIRFEN